MSVTTAADEIVINMREKIQDAFEATNNAFCEICVKGTMWGADEYSNEFKQKLTEAQSTLAELKIKMSRT